MAGQGYWCPKREAKELNDAFEAKAKHHLDGSPLLAQIVPMTSSSQPALIDCWTIEPSLRMAVRTSSHHAACDLVGMLVSDYACVLLGSSVRLGIWSFDCVGGVWSAIVIAAHSAGCKGEDEIIRATRTIQK